MPSPNKVNDRVDASADAGKEIVGKDVVRGWLSRYGINAVIVVAMGAAFYKWLLAGKSIDEMTQVILSVFLVALGFGLLIFIHELGHFLAAKLCNVRVDAFSIGFGPPLPGCHFKYGETEYKLAWLPLGGYVKMPGEYPSDTMDPEVANDPRTFMNQSVGERMFIISAGVVMNLVLAVLLFIYVYLAGKEEIVPRLGLISPGSPAAEAGMRAGSELLEINGNTKLSYEDLFLTAAFSTPDVTRIHFRWRTPDGEIREADVTPRKAKTDAKPFVGVQYPSGLQVPKHFKKNANVGAPGSPALRAGLQPGDELRGVRLAARLAVTEPESAAAAGTLLALPFAPAALAPIPPCLAGVTMLPAEKEFKRFTNGYSVIRAEYEHRGQPIELLVARGQEERVVVVGPRYFAFTGIFATMGPIVSTRDPRFVPEAAKEFRRGDVVVALNGNEIFDPLRLPDLVMDATQGEKNVDFTVRRDGKEYHLSVPSSAFRGYGTWNEERPIGANAVISIPALGIAYEVSPKIKHVVPDSPADKAGVKAGRVIEEIGAENPELDKTRYYKLSEYSWPSLYWQYLAESADRKVFLRLAGDEEPKQLQLVATDDPTWPMADRGLVVDYERSVMKADSVGQAIGLGFRDTFRWVGRIYLSLKGLLTRDIQAEKMLQGPVGIAQSAFMLASANFTQFVMYLGMFSVNLAVVNFLPIPILDGGHMVFLIVEKLRGKRASERALIIANSIGLAIIASLMLFVIYLDISKLTFFQRLWPWD